VCYSVEDTGNATTLKLYRNTSDLFGVDPYPWTNASLTPDIHKEAEELNGLAKAVAGAKNASFCDAILVLKTMILPRQAQDKHRKNSRQQAFLCR